MAIVDNYSKEKFEQIAKESKTIPEFLKNLGYKSDSTKTRNVLMRKIEEYNLDISHLKQRPEFIRRTEQDIFIENSIASQHTLREWYKKGEYTSYICSICGQEPFWQGKELTLILDHINGSNHDDRLENLRWVCPNCNQQLETTGYKKMRVPQEKLEKNYCIDCGKEILKESTRCIQCAGKNNSIPIEEMKVTREDLKRLIREKSFLEIGRMYNVSDNAIRKWCIKLNLPKTKSEIKSYSNEEWNLI